MVLITDSVCLRLLDTDTLLVGVGNVLRLYHYDKSSKCTKQSTLTEHLTDKIHGIRRISTGDNRYHIVLLYGGREFIILQIDNNQMIFKSITRITDWINNIQIYSSEDNAICLLTSHSTALQLTYCNSNPAQEINRISCTDKSTLYTSYLCGDKWLNTLAFGGTALGDLIIWSLAPENNGAVLQRLSGHNGVIFSIDINKDYGLLTTTSDDRSVKIWNIDFDNLCVKPIKSLYGHTARIFRSKIIVDDNQPYILSIGEDSNICLWTLTGTLLHRHNLPTSAVLWNLDYDSASKTIFTCGSDGNCNQLTIQSFLNGTHCNVGEMLLNDCLMTKDEYVAKIKMLSSEIIVGLTNKNRLIFYINDKWTTVDKSSTYKCSLLECHKNFVITAGYQVISLYEYNPDTGKLHLKDEQQIMEHMIRSVKFLSDTQLLVCDENGNCLMCSINNDNLQSIGNFAVPSMSKEKWMTTALTLNDNWLIVADRSGNLHLFELHAIDGQIVWQHTIKRLHGHMGCTCLQRKPLQTVNNSFISCGHDGTIKHIYVDHQTKTLCHFYTEKYPIQWIEKIIHLNRNQLLTVGFNDNHFVVCDEQRQIIIEFECGGGHRYWDLCINPNIFLFIRKKKLFRMEYLVPKTMSSISIPQTRWHIKSCNFIQQISLRNTDILISGGDDNILMFSQLNVNNDLKYLCNMTQHISNIKTIAACSINDDDKTFLIFSAGGRAQICVTQFDPRNSQLYDRSQYMLRLTDLERKQNGKGQLIDFDPETRFMCMDIVHNKDDKNVYNLFIGCSDGYLRHIQYKMNTQKFDLIDCQYYGKCFLHLKILSDSNVLLTAATDGKICFWQILYDPVISLSKEPIYQLKHHDSGINSFDLMEHENVCSIATGGDDQGIVISKFHISNRQMIKFLCAERLPSLHTAQVNGILFSKDANYLYSCGVDQRLHKIDLDSGCVSSTYRTCVADVKGILYGSHTNQILVYGSGFESIDLDDLR